MRHAQFWSLDHYVAHNTPMFGRMTSTALAVARQDAAQDRTWALIKCGPDGVLILQRYVICRSVVINYKQKKLGYYRPGDMVR